MLEIRGDLARCGCCAGPDPAGRIRRRGLLKAAVFQGAEHGTQRRAGDVPERPRAAAGCWDVATGVVVDASPHVITLIRGGLEERFTLTSGTSTWKGGRADPTALATGDRVVLRLDPSRRDAAERVWACIGRVTGVILERDRDSLLVDQGKTKRHQVIVIPDRAASRIQVRFPRLEPGYLIDVIGLRRGDEVEGLVPATSQPAYRAGLVTRPAPIAGRVPARISGSATWHEPLAEPGEPGDMQGVAYPALDPDGGCAEESSAAAGAGLGSGSGSGCAPMPYLSVGSLLHIRNECTGSARVLPVTGCGAVARLFCDRCVTCGTSPRGRVADLALASFVALGGEPERGCFNATIAMGQP
jgi:hypothetical protein